MANLEDRIPHLDRLSRLRNALRLGVYAFPFITNYFDGAGKLDQRLTPTIFRTAARQQLEDRPDCRPSRQVTPSSHLCSVFTGVNRSEPLCSLSDCSASGRSPGRFFPRQQKLKTLLQTDVFVRRGGCPDYRSPGGQQLAERQNEKS
ncbi:hypothetical protein EYF80_022469 [Liparis tanakae]|uniref:Uncharacterized protein n=1 Tax=Liparis tanakae TaxID=230148 RepID=A0A4Z2HRE5_9TELE|nr:hypothetical protein EYF80_022469 [Liparis tanakae]